MAKMDESQEKTWGMLCHLAALSGFVIPFGNIIGPLIIWLVKKEESEYVDKQGKESLNFQISMTIYAIVAGILVLVVVGIILLIALGIAVLVLVIVAAIKASNREEFSYPLTIRIIQ
ncbi:MAG: DUF4870 domain-containing protein [Candidatus Aminicenantes bacterium]|nr:DUF4870 domain-containing protein [Candidatus Aminicenantes bacterium]